MYNAVVLKNSKNFKSTAPVVGGFVESVPVALSH